MPNIVNFFTRFIQRWQGSSKPIDEVTRAKQLIKAIDKGGLPLDPSIVRRVAEGLGLEVSRNAKMADTIERIRAALKRSS